MSTVAIVGAGPLGGTLAHTLAARDRHREVRLVDDAHDVAAGKALDIAQAGPIGPFRTTVVAAARPAGVVGADVVVLAEPVGATDTAWTGEAGLAVLRQVVGANRRAVVVHAGADPGDLLERGVGEAGVERRRLVGSAPEAWRGAVQALVALEIGCAPSDVALAVLGRPPTHPVVAWSRATAAGVALDAWLAPPRLARVQARVERLHPLGPYVLAAGAARVVTELTSGHVRRPCCLVVDDGEHGLRGRARARPVELDRYGVTRVLDSSVSPRERAQLVAIPG